MVKKIAVIGLGYVGLPLVLLAEEKGFDVIGVDQSQTKIDLLKKNVSPIGDAVLVTKVKKSKAEYTADISKISAVDIAVICVPTPVDENKNPDLTIVKEAVLDSARHLKNNSLLVIESTINPGVCDEMIIPLIEEGSNHRIGKSLFLAHCPERINPGDPKWHVGNINRVLGADSEESMEIAHKFYSTLIDADIKKMNSIKEAEAVKIVENSFRDINIAFVNELAMSFNKLGIDTNSVIDGAATKPFAFMAHYPGIGVGGHCIPIDPYYLIEYARGNGFEHHFLKHARSINENMPVYCVDKVEQTLIENGLGSLQNKSVLLLGLSYKANVGDKRESPAEIVVSTLLARGAKVETFDPYFIDVSTYKSLEEINKGLDAVILATNHSDFQGIDLKKLKSGCVFFDGRNAFKSKISNFSDLDINYLSL